MVHANTIFINKRANGHKGLAMNDVNRSNAKKTQKDHLSMLHTKFVFP